MLYLAIPAHNEAATIGVLLWRLRTVLAEFPREYEAVVYDDASSDSTSEILEGYARVMPLTIIRGEKHLGYAGAVNALVRHVARQTRYPRRDAMLLMQGDFTDPPAMVPEFVKRFEGGADLVVGERAATALKDAPIPVKRMQLATGWMLRLFVKAEGVRDVTSSFRLIRISVLRDLLRNAGDAPVCVGDSQSANADLLLHLIPLARRVETIEIEPTWGVRLRETRLVAMRDGLALARWAWRARGRKAVASTMPDTGSDAPRAPRPARERERDGSNVLPFEPVETQRSAQSRPAASASTTNGVAARKARPARPIASTDDGDEVTPLASARAKPPRRKRSRGGRKDSAPGSNDADNEPSDLVPSAETPYREPAPRNDAELSSNVSDAAVAEPAFIERPALSPALSEAAEAAEDSFEAEATSARPPRKRRRRRGSRKGGSRTGEGAEGEASTEPDFVGEESGGDESASENSDSPYAEDAAPTGRQRKQGRVARDSASSDSDTAERSDTHGDSSDANESGDLLDGADDANDDGANGEPRARRRGRRGRRGGSRRNRTSRGEGASEGATGEAASGGGEHFESGPSTASADGQ